MTGTITNKLTGKTVKVHDTKDHPDSNYGNAVWVDDDNNAYIQVGMESSNPMYDFKLDEPYKTRQRIGSQLAEARSSKNITTRAMHELTGINHSNISQIERGVISATLDSVARLASELGLELNLTPTE